MSMKFLATISIFMISLLASAQTETEQFDVDADLLFYGDVMVNGLEASTRIRAAAQFEKTFDYYLDTKGSLDESQPFAKFISILSSPSDEFKLVSWLVKEESGRSDYKGYIVFDDRVVKLDRTSYIMEETAYSTSKTDNWYGCLYYSILPFGKSSYLIFGYDAQSKYDHQKIVDVLTIEGSEIKFGAAVFEDKTEPGTYLNRIILSYSSDATVTLNYNPGLDVIMHDHLQQRMGQQAGQGPTFVPDGTYEGYKLEKGLWVYKKKLYDHVYENAPRPKPVFQEHSDTKSVPSRK